MRGGGLQPEEDLATPEGCCLWFFGMGGYIGDIGGYIGGLYMGYMLG